MALRFLQRVALRFLQAVALGQRLIQLIALLVRVLVGHLVALGQRLMQLIALVRVLVGQALGQRLMQLIASPSG